MTLLSANFLALPQTISDHNPLLLVMNELSDVGPFPFRFEIMWNSHSDFRNKFVDWWNIPIHGSPMFRILKKLKHVKSMVKGWNKRVFGHVFHKKSALGDKLKVIRKRMEEGDVSLLTCN